MKKILVFIFLYAYSFSCQETPDNNILNGLDYQAKVANNSDCQSMYNDNGDGNGFFFSNTNLDSTCAGFCYYNLPNTTVPDPEPDPDPNPEEPIDNGDTVDLSKLIPYIDEIEQKNQNIVNSLNTLNSNLNNNFGQINNNSQALDSTMQNLNTTLENIDDTLQNLDIPDGSTSTEPDYTGVTDSLNINPDISSELNSFRTEIKNSLESSFNSYTNVFGLGGYGSAPNSITFSLLGKTYTVFNISYINPYIEHIRNIFLITAYIFGLFLVFRGN